MSCTEKLTELSGMVSSLAEDFQALGTLYAKFYKKHQKSVAHAEWAKNAISSIKKNLGKFNTLIGKEPVKSQDAMKMIGTMNDLEQGITSSFYMMISNPDTIKAIEETTKDQNDGWFEEFMERIVLINGKIFEFTSRLKALIACLIEQLHGTDGGTVGDGSDVSSAIIKSGDLITDAIASFPALPESSDQSSGFMVGRTGGQTDWKRHVQTSIESLLGGTLPRIGDNTQSKQSFADKLTKRLDNSLQVVEKEGRKIYQLKRSGAGPVLVGTGGEIRGGQATLLQYYKDTRKSIDLLLDGLVCISCCCDDDAVNTGKEAVRDRLDQIGVEYAREGGFIREKMNFLFGRIIRGEVFPGAVFEDVQALGAVLGISHYSDLLRRRHDTREITIAEKEQITADYDAINARLINLLEQTYSSREAKGSMLARLAQFVESLPDTLEQLNRDLIYSGLSDVDVKAFRRQVGDVIEWVRSDAEQWISMLIDRDALPREIALIRDSSYRILAVLDRIDDDEKLTRILHSGRGRVRRVLQELKYKMQGIHYVANKIVPSELVAVKTNTTIDSTAHEA